jgi:hypothetical protein
MLSVRKQKKKKNKKQRSSTASTMKAWYREAPQKSKEKQNFVANEEIQF